MNSLSIILLEVDRIKYYYKIRSVNEFPINNFTRG